MVAAMVVAMVGAMGLLWLLPWDCYGCCHGIAMVVAMGLLWLLPSYGCCYGIAMVAAMVVAMVYWK